MKDIKEIFDPVYRQMYWYVCCPTFEKFRNIMKRVKITLEPRDGTEGYMLVWQIDIGRVVIIIWTKNKNPDLLAHELLHCVSYILRKRGIPLNDDTEEAYCYLMQFLMKEIVK